MIQFTPTVGVAPGTTTMNLGNPRAATGLTCLGLMGQPCPPDPRPYLISVPPPKASAARTAQPLVTYDPYADLARLRGAGLGAASAGSFFVPAALAFAALVGFGFWRTRR
jgi:hypothetical protein